MCFLVGGFLFGTVFQGFKGGLLFAARPYQGPSKWGEEFRQMKQPLSRVFLQVQGLGIKNEASIFCFHQCSFFWPSFVELFLNRWLCGCFCYSNGSPAVTNLVDFNDFFQASRKICWLGSFASFKVTKICTVGWRVFLPSFLRKLGGEHSGLTSSIYRIQWCVCVCSVKWGEGGWSVSESALP